MFARLTVIGQLLIWLVGREIVLEIQAGEKRAEYGKQALKELSHRLTEQYGSGFSVTNLLVLQKVLPVVSGTSGDLTPTGC